MAVSFVAGTVVAAGAASSKSVARPAGAAEGDLLIAGIVVFPTTVAITPPAGQGWNTLLAKTDNATGGFSVALFYRWDDGSAGPWTFDTTGASWADGECLAYRGLAGSGDPLDAVQATVDASNGVSATYTGVTTTQADDLVLFFLASGNSRTISPDPTGFTSRFNPPTSSNYVADKTQAAAGATGDVSATWTGNQNSIGVVVALSTTAAGGVTVDISDLDLSNDEQQKTALIRIADEVGLSVAALDLNNEGHKQTLIKQLAAAEGIDLAPLNLDDAAHQRAFIVGRASGSVVPPFEPAFIEGSDAPGAAEKLDLLYGGDESGSWLTTKLPDNTAVAPTSAAAVDYIVNANPGARWINGVNDGNFTSIINVVPADQPLVEVVPRGNATQVYAEGLASMFAAGIPIPDDIPPFPPGDTDAELVIVQPDWQTTIDGTTYVGRMYELWVAQHPSTSVSGKWEASWGGRMVGIVGDSAPLTSWDANNPTLPVNRLGHWIDYFVGDPADPDGIYADHNWGAQATSIPLYGTIISRLDIIRGVIKHPLHFMMPVLFDELLKASKVWPAQRWDGSSHVDCIQGYRFRLPAGYVIDPAWPWLTRLIATAARDYGIVFTDTVGGSTGPTFRMEPGGADLVPGDVNMGSVMNAFPWADLQQIAIGSDTEFNPTV